mgnify:CR=1 FL=1
MGRLHLSAGMGAVGALSVLLEDPGTEVNAMDDVGETPLHPEVAACRKMWAKPNDMDADSTSSEDENKPVPTRVPPSVLRRKMKQRKAKRIQREARKAEASAPQDDKRALREYVQTATERVSGGDASKALNTATAEVARARREAEQLAQQARALRQESSDEESSESEYSDGPGMDAALRKRQEDDLKKARREAAYADLETKRALAKARVQEEMERVKFIRRSIAEKNLADTRAQEAEALKKDAKQQKKAVETIKIIAKKRAASPVKPRAPVKKVLTDEELMKGEVAAFFLREPPREQLRFLKFALEPEQKKDLPAVAVAFKHANKPEEVMHDRTFDNAVLVEHICLDLEHQHVAYLRPYCLLLGVLIGRKPNLRKALLMGIVKTLNGRMKGREKETFAKTPTLDAADLVLLQTDAFDGAASDADTFRFRAGATLEDLEYEYIKHTLANNRNSSYADVAKLLGISKKTLWEKRKRYNLDEEVEEMTA